MTPRYKLRTLLILLAIMPPLLAVGWWKYSAWWAEQESLATAVDVPDGGSVLLGGLQPDPPQPKAPLKAGEWDCPQRAAVAGEVVKAAFTHHNKTNTL